LLIGEGPDRPAWLAFDKQVLCFDAYFQESITERPAEQYRIRKCRVYFYPEDDTVQGPFILIVYKIFPIEAFSFSG
jgi:hypothetical protein